ncbi:hypothetical protein H2198_007270 [Neophaeococcomyces mojaviensis]|uniref:Uncharacterized protein n=1 Tax=Neophaeococcomyces mojaviensis TaxID=3383035 RepID=A0ACC3A0L9_9EURO|nr:hypothetical protein H2198_007270 [Knufia sp. JES_112]
MKIKYHGIAQDEREMGVAAARNSSRWKQIAIISFVMNVLLSITTLTKILLELKKQPISEYLRETSSYSPLLNSISLNLDHSVINGTLFPNTSPPSIWRQNPSPAVDEAWESISDTSLFRITRADVLALGRDPSTTTAVPPSYNLGADLYFAELDGQHQLHCLNAIRKYAYFPYYFGDKYNDTISMPVFHQHHLSHCLDILRQNLLCQESTDIITYQWVEGQSIPQPDFSIEKVCKRRDQIVDWLDRRYLPLTDDMKVNVPRPENVAEIEVPASPYWNELVEKARAAGIQLHEYVE